MGRGGMRMRSRKVLRNENHTSIRDTLFRSHQTLRDSCQSIARAAGCHAFVAALVIAVNAATLET